MGLISRVSSRTYRRQNLKIFIMQIFVKDGETRVVQVESDDFINDILTEAQNGARVLSGGEILDGDATFEENGLEDEATIEVVYNLLGGGRKRKKKVYTTPKKIKHKRV